MIQALQCEGYKVFKKPLTIQLPQITIIFGKNSSGKTSLARLPVLVAASLTNPYQFYTLSSRGLTFGSSFTDLANSQDPHPSLSLGIQWSSRRRLNITLQHISSQEDPDSVQPSFIQIDGTRRNIRLRPTRTTTSKGLVDSRLTSDARRRLDQRITSLSHLLEDLIHIPSARPTTDAIYSVRPPEAWVTDEVPYILLSRRRLLNDVDRWFQQYLDRSGVGIDLAAFAFRLVESRDDYFVNFTQSGRGPQSSLPVVTLLLAVASGIKRSPLVIVEEPEAHLHPSVHGDVADLVLSCASKSQIIVETHSENFLLRVRRRIAEGLIESEQVGLYFIDDTHDVFRIPLDAFGGTDQWPTGVFESDVDEARAIVQAKISAMTALGDPA
jgi:AAA domain, putative AbiEii toxin, Type IV TA system